MTNNHCPNCKEEVSQLELKCSNCEFPLAGTEKEKAVFIGRQIANKSKLQEAKQSHQKVQRILFIVAGFQFLNAFLVYHNYQAIESTIFYAVLGILLTVFGFLCPKRPLVFISLALALMLGYYTLLYFTDPMLIHRGILWKLIILGFLVYGLIQAYDEYKLRKRSNFLKNS